MGRSDDARLGVAKEDRPAIGGKHAQHHAGCRADQRIGLRPCAVIIAIDHDDIG